MAFGKCYWKIIQKFCSCSQQKGQRVGDGIKIPILRPGLQWNACILFMGLCMWVCVLCTLDFWLAHKVFSHGSSRNSWLQQLALSTPSVSSAWLGQLIRYIPQPRPHSPPPLHVNYAPPAVAASRIASERYKKKGKEMWGKTKQKEQKQGSRGHLNTTKFIYSNKVILYL